MPPRASRLHAAALALSLILAGSCGRSAPTGVDDGTPAPAPTVGPFLGLEPNPPDALPESLGVVAEMARQTGVTLFVVNAGWDAIEQSGGAIDWFGPASQLGWMRGSRFATFLDLCLADSRIRHVPGDLSALAWDDPALVARADRMVDSLGWLAREQRVVGVSLGREVDRYFETHAGEFPAFLALYRRLAARLRAAAPGVPVGIGTSCPIGNPLAHFGDSLNGTSDIVVHTLYPTAAGGYAMQTPAAFASRLDATLSRRGGKPLVLHEVGYASAAALGGSPDSQAVCVRRFREWYRARTANELLLANWRQCTDVSSSGLRYLSTYHGGFTPEQTAFHGSLGLRDSLGVPKPAWAAWRGS